MAEIFTFVSSSAEDKSGCWRQGFGTLKERKAIYMELKKEVSGKQMFAGLCREKGMSTWHQGTQSPPVTRCLVESEPGQGNGSCEAWSLVLHLQEQEATKPRKAQGACARSHPMAATNVYWGWQVCSKILRKPTKSFLENLWSYSTWGTYKYYVGRSVSAHKTRFQKLQK